MIRQRYKIYAPIEKVWGALTSEKIIEKWGGGPVKFVNKVNGKFSFWGGDIWGKNLEITNKKKLVQEWYGGNWDKPSRVTFILKSNGDTTSVELTHEDVPENEEADFADGWRRYYMGEVKKLLET